VIFLDTNVVSEPMRRGGNERVIQWLKEHEAKTAISTIVLAEIGYGIFSLRPKERSPRYLQQFFGVREQYAERTYSFDQPSALIYGQLMGRQKLNGSPTSMADGMIAAIALCHNATLATRNTEHFTGLGLELINPWD
jgi:toxin FitB